MQTFSLNINTNFNNDVPFHGNDEAIKSLSEDEDENSEQKEILSHHKDNDVKITQINFAEHDQQNLSLSQIIQVK